jgi:hypothetical protein
MLAVFYTHNRLKPQLLEMSKLHACRAQDFFNRTSTDRCDMILSSWKPVELPAPDDANVMRKNLIFPFHQGGHLNIILQLMRALRHYRESVPDSRTLVCLLEHDVLYHSHYLKAVFDKWRSNPASAGINMRSFIGLNETGFLRDRWRHYPLSMMSADLDWMLGHLDERLHECLSKGGCVIEPAHKLFDDLDRYTVDGLEIPLAVHVNMNHSIHNHHFTNHYDAYEPVSTLPEVEGWPDGRFFAEALFDTAFLPHSDHQNRQTAGLPDLQQTQTVQPHTAQRPAVPQDMLFIGVQPKSDFYVWQLDVQLYSFREAGIPLQQCCCVMVNQGADCRTFDALRQKYPPVRWIELDDERPARQYVSSVRPWALSRIFTRFPEFAAKHVFYLDADVIFRSLPDFNAMRDGRCHLSDTVSYTGYEYIRQFGEHYPEAMAEIVGIPAATVAAGQSVSGGAQYFFAPGVLSPSFWDKVYQDCERMYPMLDAMVKKEQHDFSVTLQPGDSSQKHVIQHWCSDMWCLLWNLWLAGAVTVIDGQLSFSWATSPLSEWERHNLYHNAGVTADRRHEMFYKSDFRTLPDTLDTSGYRSDVCSVRYVELIKKATAKIKVQ